MTIVIVLLAVIALAHLEDAIMVALLVLHAVERTVFSYFGLLVGSILLMALVQS